MALLDLDCSLITARSSERRTPVYLTGLGMLIVSWPKKMFVDVLDLMVKRKPSVQASAWPKAKMLGA